MTNKEKSSIVLERFLQSTPEMQRDIVVAMAEQLMDAKDIIAKAVDWKASRGSNMSLHHRTLCHLCRDDAVAIFYMSHGCACSAATTQPLCHQHAIRATPAGSMELIKDLTEGKAFTKYFENRKAPQ